MRDLYRLLIICIIMVSLLAACEVQQPDDRESSIENEKEAEFDSNEESKDMELYENDFLIENYENSSWEMDMFVIEAIQDIFILKERYYKQEFNYDVLVDGLGEYFDFPKIFMKPDDVYGIKDQKDYSTAVTNEDTANLTDAEFEYLLGELSFFAYSSDIGLYGGDNYEYDAIHSDNRRYLISSIIEKDDNSVVVYLKEINSYNITDGQEFPFDTSVTDYWFLFKRDSGMIYSFNKWGTSGYESELNINSVQTRDETLEMQMYEITDSIVGDIR